MDERVTAFSQFVFAVPRAPRCEGSRALKVAAESPKCFGKIVSAGGCLLLNAVESARQFATEPCTKLRYSLPFSTARWREGLDVDTEPSYSKAAPPAA